MKYYYDNYVADLSRKFLSRLEDIKADYNFDLGDEFEIAICEILRTFCQQNMEYVEDLLWILTGQNKEMIS